MEPIPCGLTIWIDSAQLFLSVVSAVLHANTRSAGPWQTFFHPLVMIARKAGSSAG